jgi:hypothetical protein
MTSRKSLAPVPLTCMLAVGFLGIAPVTNAAAVGLSLPHPGKNISNDVVEIKARGRGAGIYTPIAPSYRYYDYPYYYSRGFYPTHIRPGFIYYGYPYSYYTSRYRKFGSRARKD